MSRFKPDTKSGQSVHDQRERNGTINSASGMKARASDSEVEHKPPSY